MRWFIARDSDILAVHAVLLPTGQILYFGGDENDLNQAKSFEQFRNLNAINHTRLFDCRTFQIDDPGSPTTDVFCSGHALMGDGHLLVAGGTYELSDAPGEHSQTSHLHHSPGIRDTWIFIPDMNTGMGNWVKAADMNQNPEPHQPNPLTSGGRWYPTLITLSDGKILAMCGHPGVGDCRHNNHTPEIFDPRPLPTGRWMLCSGVGDSQAPTNPLSGESEKYFYPRVYLLPTGDLFSITPLHWDPLLPVEAQKSTLFSIPNGVFRPLGQGLLPPHDGSAATSVLLPLLPENNYRPRVLVCGGKIPQIIDLADLNNPNLQWQNTSGRELQRDRWYCNAILLPTGDIFVCGGVTPSLNQNQQFEFLDYNHVLEPEIYDPSRDTWQRTGKWSNLPPANVTRQYHSVALLMPDGRVWTAGSNIDHDHSFPKWTPEHPDRVTGSKAELRIEIFEPWYHDVPRPQIASAPQSLITGLEFHIDTPQASSIARVVMLRAGSVTHAFNSDQRYIGLRFKYDGGDRLLVAPPPDGNIAPLGPYLLFLIDVDGIPSEGRFIQMSVSNVFPAGTKVTAVSTHRDSTSLYLNGHDGHVWSKFFPSLTDPSNWTGWFSLSPNVFRPGSTVTALSLTEGATSLYGIGLDGRVWSNFFPASNNQWSGWFALGDNVFPKEAAVTAVSTHIGGTSLYVIGLDEGQGGGRVWSKFFPDSNNPSQWSGWFRL